LQALFLPPESIFLFPRSVSEGYPPGDAVPNEVREDAVPSEARDASLSLGRTKKWELGRIK